MTQKEQEIISKIHYSDEWNITSTEQVHERDDLSNPFDALSMDELLYLREHKELLEEINH